MRTTHDDGSKDYAFQDQDGVPATFHVSPAGTLSSAHRGAGAVTMTLAYTYGPRHVALPTASLTVDSKTLTTAVTYLSMPSWVKNAATQGATDTRKAAKGATITIASLRTIVRRAVAACNTAARVTMMKVSDISAGARVSATNPWTHTSVSYTVKASGTKVLVAKG